MIDERMTPQTKWYGHTLDTKKDTNLAQQFIKDQKHKTKNKHHDSIPMVPRESSTQAFFKISWQPLLPCNSLDHAHTCQPHVPNIKTIIYINLKPTFTKTNHHVIVHSHLKVIRHNTKTITYYTQVPINSLNTYVLVPSS